MFAGVRDRDVNICSSKTVEQPPGLAGDIKGRHTVAVGHDLNVVPCDLASPAGLEGFEKGLFRGEATGV